MKKPLNSVRIECMLEAATRIAQRMPGVSLPEFLASEDLQDIALHRLLVIGKAGVSVLNDAPQYLPQLNRAAIGRMRKFVLPNYAEVELKEVWKSVVADVPALLTELPPIIAQLKTDE